MNRCGFSWIFAAALTGVAATAAHAYEITGTTVDATTVRYGVTCSSGEGPFDAFELQIHPGDSPGDFGLASGPVGWSIDPNPVMRMGRKYVRVAGPVLPVVCSSVTLELDYLGAQAINSRSAAVILAGATPVYEAADCLPGWYAVGTCTPPTPVVTAPEYILVVGHVNNGANPDPVGLATIVVRDLANQPLAGVTVSLDFAGCCDIDLCEAQPGLSCANGTVSGSTNGAGEFSFTIVGAARDPWWEDPCPTQGCVYPGCGADGVVIRVDVGDGPIEAARTTAVCLDQNGALSGGNRTTITDVGLVMHLFGGIGLGGAYRGRGDLDQNGVISIADASAMYSHFGRLALIGGVGCGGTYCGKPACP